MKNKNITIKACLKQLEKIVLPFNERMQLESLVKEFGCLGAIEYLQPLPERQANLVDRDQNMADKFREILEKLENNEW